MLLQICCILLTTMNQHHITRLDLLDKLSCLFAVSMSRKTDLRNIHSNFHLLVVCLFNFVTLLQSARQTSFDAVSSQNQTVVGIVAPPVEECSRLS